MQGERLKLFFTFFGVSRTLLIAIICKKLKKVDNGLFALMGLKYPKREPMEVPALPSEAQKRSVPPSPTCQSVIQYVRRSHGWAFFYVFRANYHRHSLDERNANQIESRLNYNSLYVLGLPDRLLTACQTNFFFTLRLNRMSTSNSSD